MSVTADQARDIIFGIFKTVWDPRPAVYTDVPGEKPASESTWARATLKHATGNQSSFGGATGKRRYTATGTAFIQVFAPVGDGSTACLAAAGEVQNAFRASRDPDVWFTNIRLREIGDDGAFEQINVQATFSYDEVR